MAQIFCVVDVAVIRFGFACVDLHHLDEDKYRDRDRPRDIQDGSGVRTRPLPEVLPVVVVKHRPVAA